MLLPLVRAIGRPIRVRSLSLLAKDGRSHPSRIRNRLAQQLVAVAALTSYAGRGAERPTIVADRPWLRANTTLRQDGRAAVPTSIVAENTDIGLLAGTGVSSSAR